MANVDQASDELRRALAQELDPVTVTLHVSRATAHKLLAVLEAEKASGAVVVPVREMYTTTESAALLGVSRASVMKLIDSGDISAVKVGTHHRIAAEELLAFQRARQVSRGRAEESIAEFSARAGAFQSNVYFRESPEPAEPGAPDAEGSS